MRPWWKPVVQHRIKQQWISIIGRRCSLIFVATLANIGCAAHTSSLRQPGEFEAQQAVWLCPEPDNDAYAPIYAQMITALKPHVEVKILSSDETALSKARAMVRMQGVDDAGLRYFSTPLATTFIRDGTVFLIDDRGGRAVLDLKWSTYGLAEWCRRLHADDPVREAECETYGSPEQDAFDDWFAEACSAKVIPSPLFLENATFEVNGKGTLLISEPLALGRNRGWSKAEIEHSLRSIPGITNVIWLAEGLAEDPLEISTITQNYIGLGANGHTDEFVRFADERTILLAWVEDDEARNHPISRINRARMVRNDEILRNSKDQDGQAFHIVHVPMPRILERKVVLSSAEQATDAWNEASFPTSEHRKAGDEVVQVGSASYLNFLIANGVVIVPSYVHDGTPQPVEDRVGQIMREAFPGRSVLFVRCTPMNWHGGGLHCATLSEPKSD